MGSSLTPEWLSVKLLAAAAVAVAVAVAVAAALLVHRNLSK